MKKLFQLVSTCKSLSVQWLSYFSPSKLSIFQNVQKFQEITLNSRFWQHWKLRMPKRGPKEELKIGVQWLRCRQCYRDTRWKIMPVLEAVTATKTGRIFHLDPYILTLFTCSDIIFIMKHQSTETLQGLIVKTLKSFTVKLSVVLVPQDPSLFLICNKYREEICMPSYKAKRVPHFFGQNLWL